MHKYYTDETNRFFYHGNVLDVADEMEIEPYEAAQLQHEVPLRYHLEDIKRVPKGAQCGFCHGDITPESTSCVGSRNTRMVFALVENNSNVVFIDPDKD